MKQKTYLYGMIVVIVIVFGIILYNDMLKKAENPVQPAEQQKYEAPQLQPASQTAAGEKVFGEKCEMCHPSLDDLLKNYPDRTKMQDVLNNISNIQPMKSVTVSPEEINALLNYFYK